MAKPLLIPHDRRKLTTSGGAQRATHKFTLLNVGFHEAFAFIFTDEFPKVDGAGRVLDYETIVIDEREDYGDGHHCITAVYRLDDLEELDQDDDPTQPPPDIVETDVSFDLASGGERVTHSIRTRNAYLANGITDPATPPDFQNAINIVDDQVLGFEVDPRAMAEKTFSVGQRVKNTLITNAWAQEIESRNFLVNSIPFRGRQPGEVMFFGLSGTVDLTAEFSNLSWDFGYRKNLTNVTIGKFSGVNKRGWDLSWIYHESKFDDSEELLIKNPIALYIEQIFFEGDLSFVHVAP